MGTHYSAVKQNYIFSILMNLQRISILIVAELIQRAEISEFGQNLDLFLYSYCLLLHEEFTVNSTFCQMLNLDVEQTILHKFYLMQLGITEVWVKPW